MSNVGAGGTPGGVRQFLIGFVLAVVGGWLLLNQVTVTSGPWMLWGHNSFGLSLLPLVAGIALLFFNGKSLLGWLLSIGGLAIVLAAVIVNLQVYFRPTSLFDTLVMLALLFGGIGLIIRSLSTQA